MSRNRPAIALVLAILVSCSPHDSGDGGGPPPPGAPAAPTAVSATATSSSTISVVWTDNSSNENGFVLERSSSGSGPFNDVAAVGANVTSHVDGGLTASTTYYYRVRATGSSGDSAPSNVVQATTSASGPPAAPSGASAITLGSSSIRLTWTDNSSNETGFKIERSLSSGSGFTQVGTVGANVTTYDSTGLTASTTYYFRVRATNGSGDSAYSNTANAATTSASSLPAAPSGATASALSSSSIHLTWTDNSSNETGFKIERSLSSGSGFTQVGTVGANVTTYDSTGLTASTTYYFRVRATNGSGDSAYSNTANATTSGVANYTLTVTKSGTGSGTVTSSPAGISCGTTCSASYASGTSVTLTASPTAGATFSSWTGCTSSSGTSCTVSMTSSKTVTATFSASSATLRVVNQSHYDIITANLNGVNQITYPYVIPVGTSNDYTFASSGNVSYYVAVGFWNGTSRDEWFTYSGTQYVTLGQTTTLNIPNPTMAQMLSGFSSYADWVGDYWHNLTPYSARYHFTSAGAWSFYDNGTYQTSGTVSLASWPDYAMCPTFKLCSTCTAIQLCHPFGDFYFQNGPSDWPTIDYIRQ